MRNILERVNSFDADRFKSLTLALRRFNLSYDRHHPEDRLIDQMISFEALYLDEVGGGDRAEKRFRLALRVSYFLDPGQNRKTIYEDMRHAYDLRGNVVHGGESATDLEDVAAKAEGYLRQSLLEFLDRAAQPGATPPLVRWDDLLFPGTLPLS